MSRNVQRQRPEAESDLAPRPRLHVEVEDITSPQAEAPQPEPPRRLRASETAEEPVVMFGQRVPVSLQREVKIAAVRRGIELQEAAVEAWQAWLATQHESQYAGAAPS